MTTYYYSKNTGTNGLNPYNKTTHSVKEQKPSVGEKLLHTTGDIFANIISGAAKGLEGIVDLGAGIGGAIAGIFDKNAQNDVKNFMAKDLTGELFANKWQDDLKYSYLNDSKVGQFAEKTFNAVGQMLPAVAVGLVTGGAGAAASVSQAASLATMGVSAAGTSTEEAYNEGADYYKGLGYGLASGAVEMATEKMTGGALKGVIGKGMLDGVGKVAATGAKRVLKNAVEEGAEEVVSELANPALKSIYKGKEAFDEYGDAEYWKGVAEAGLVGGATSVVYGGTVGKVLAKTGHGYTGKDADVAESAEKVRELENERNELWADGKLTAEQNAKIDGYVARNSANIEAVLKNSNQEKRAKLIREFNLESRFDENGNRKSLQSNAENARYLSPSISRTQVDSDLRNMTEDLRQEYARQNGGNIEIAAKDIPDMRVYDGKLSAKGEQAYTRFKKAVNALNRLSGVDVGVAVLAPNPTARYNGSIMNDNIYIAADNFEDETWAKTLVHEYTHFAEGTAAYNNLVSFLSSDKDLNVAAIGEYIDRGYAANGGADIDSTGEIEYNRKEEYRKTPYSQYRTLAKIWSHETGTKVGDMRDIYNPKSGKFDTIVADNSDDGYHVISSRISNGSVKSRIKERKNHGSYSRKSEADRRLHRYDAGAEDGRTEDRVYTDVFGERGTTESVDRLHREESAGRGFSDTLQSDNVGESRVDSSGRGDLTVAELAYVKRIVSNKNFTSETGAIMSERALGNERFIAKLVRSDTTLAEKVISKIKDGIENLRSFQTAEKRAEYKFLQQAEKLYLKAIEEAGYKYVGGKIIRPDKDEEDVTETESEEQKYSKKVAKYIPYDKIGNENIRAIRRKLSDIYQGIDDAIADGIAIENDNTIYVVDSGKDNGEIRFGIRLKIEIDDNTLRKQRLVVINDRAISKGFISSELFGQIKRSSGDGGGSSVERQLQKELSVDTRESEDNEGRISSENGDRGVRGLKFSLKTDSKGRELSEGQKEFFKDSKVVDKEGNLLVMYHGTNLEFNTFDLSKAGSNFGETAQGFFFFTNKKDSYPDSAIDYAREASKRTGKPIVKEVYLNIKKPLKLNSKGYYNTVAYYDKNSDNIYEQYFKGDYDGVIIEDSDKASDDSILCLVDSANRIKRTDNLRPTDSEDIRYSLKEDSEGRKLSEAQIEYFKDSKVVDEQGRLLVVYHGSPAVFTVFDTEKIGRNGSQEGKGIYFTDNKNFAEGYSENGGQLLKGYLNIKKPLSDNSRTLSRKQVEKLIRAIDPTGDELLANYAMDSRYYGTGNHHLWYTSAMKDALEMIMSGCDTDSEIMAELANAGAGATLTLKIAYEEFGYDGYIVRGKYAGADIYVAFDSSQFKKVTNINPTNNKDIRYSLKPFAQQVDDVLNGVDTNSTHVLVAEHTPDILLKAGLSDKPMLMTATHTKTAVGVVIKNKNIHSLSVETLKKLPELIKNPAIIMDSVKSGSIVMFIGARDKNGKPLLCAVKLDGSGVYNNVEIGSNVITSVYGKEGNLEQYIRRAVIEDRIIFWDKKKSQELFNTPGLQLPDAIKHLDSDVIIRRTRAKVNTENKNSEKFKFSLKEADETSRKNAQYNAEKVYTKKDVKEVLKNVCACLEFDDGRYGDIAGHKGEITDMLYEALNTKPEGERYKTALDIADYIIDNAVIENTYDNDSDAWAVGIINALRPYLHKIKLDSIKGEIKHRYGNDRRVYLLWSSKNGLSPDVVGRALAEEGIEIDALNEADIFFKIDELYTEAKRTLNEKKREGLSKAFEEEELQRIRSDMAKEILRGYDYTGEQTAYARMKQKYDEKISSLKNHIGELTEKNFAANSLLDSIAKLRKINKGEFLNSTQYKPDIFKATIGRLTAIEYRGNINKSGTRRLIMNLREWYQPENNMFTGDGGIQDNELYRSRTSYNEDIGTILDIISSGKGDLSLIELKYLKYAVDYFTNLISTHNKIRRNGVYVEAKPVAERLVKIARENKNIRLGWLENAYTRTFGDPYSVVRLMDKYAMDKNGETGFYTETYDEFRKSAISAAEMMMHIRMPIDEFINENKGYINKISVEKVKYNAGDDDSSAVEITKANALSLYMTLKRKQALKGMAHSGFLFVENGKDVRIPGFLGTDVEITDETIEGIADIIKDRLFSQFSEADKKYISIIEKALNEDCKLAKYAVDMRRQGYSNVLDDYYFPIRRAHIAKSVDSYINEMDCVSNAPFNKNTVKGAKNELLISSVSEVVDRHIRAVSMYSCLAEAIDNYNVLFNIDIAENVNKPVSVRTETADIWRKKKDNTFENKANDYFKNLVKDIQGISTEGNTVWARGLSFIRGGYAKFQLGLNPKVLFSQLSSYIASGSVLDYSALVKGMTISGKDVDKYCPLARIRNYDKSAIKAQGVIDKVGTVGDLLMKPISMVDRFVITRLFGACQAQAEINGKGKVGSKSNLKAAGELLTKVILNTQQNNLATERSAAMRSNNEFMKTITMFSADAMKVMGRVIDTIGESSALKKRIKDCTDPARRAELESRLKEVRKREAKSISALVMSAVYMACVAQLFRWLYNRDDEDENIALNMALDAIGNLFGGLPGIKDLYAKLVDGYELDNYAYSVINDLFDSVDGIFSSAEKVIDGKAEKQDFTSLIKKMFYSVGQLFGIPVRNLYNMATGITRRISPAAGYKIDAFFYSKNYRSDLKKALENGDEKMIATIAGLIMNEDVGDIKDGAVREELDTLIKDGYDVLPRIIGDNVTYNGAEYALNAKDREYIESMYTNANESLSNIMKTTRYKNASAAVRAKTVKNTYRLSYEIAVADIAGDEASSEKNVLFSQVFDVALLSFILAAVSNLASDKDKNGNAVNGSLKRKIEYYLDTLNLTKAQKYIIMGYLGYKSQDGEKEVKGYISRFGLTSSQQDSILEYCGY